MNVPKNEEIISPKLLSLISSQEGGTIVWEDVNLFFKLVEDLEKEFPKDTWSKTRREKPREIYLNKDGWRVANCENSCDGVKYITLFTSGSNKRYVSVWMLSTPVTRAYFLS